MAIFATPAVALETELLQGEEARRVLSDGDFVARWKELYRCCSWSTAYLSVEYATAWYGSYDDVYEPLLIRSFSADGSLAGLLALGVSKKDRTLVTVGAPRAEYSAWLSAPQSPKLFIESALNALRRHFPDAELKFRFLAPGTPIEWARSGGRWASWCVVLDVDRPEVELQLESIRRSLSKRNNRNRLSRLRRFGPLAFRRVTDVGTLANIVDSILVQHDLRSIALHGMPPSRSDTRTREFYLELMRCGKLHVTVSEIGQEVVAAMIGICDRETMHLELLCHSPRFSAYSPGKLHLLTLAEHLVTEGYKSIDLTPGDLLWKDRSATNFKAAHELIVAFNRSRLLRAQTRILATHRAKRMFKPVLSWLKLEPRMLKDAARQLRDVGLRSFLGKALRKKFSGLRGSAELKGYYFDGVNDFPYDDCLFVKKDALEDLFLLNESSVGLKRAFLRRAHDDLCAGERVFSHTERGRLMGLCWVKAIENDFEANDAVSPSCFLLHDPYYDPQADRSQLSLAFVRSIARACRLQLPNRAFTLYASESDRELTAALEALRRETISARNQRVASMTDADLVSGSPLPC